MQIILLEKIANVGNLGDVVKVKDGFARNFLIPQGKAKRATPDNIKLLESKRAELEAAANAKLSASQAQAEKLEGLMVQITQKAGVDGRLFGSVTNADIDIFKRSWEIWKGGPIDFDKSIEPFEDGIPAIPIFTNSAKGRRKMRKLLYYSINRARESIYLTTAYFTPSIRMLYLLEDAVSRGVKVRMLLPGRSDVISAHYAGRAFFAKLLKSGVEIYNYRGEILHAKTAIFDCNWSVVGSANLDFQSLRRNDEGNVGIIDEDFGRQMAEVFYEDLKQSEQIILEKWKQRSLWEKIKESFFVIFRMRL